MKKIKDRALGALLGLAVGDALGGPLEFRMRGRFEPITGMVAGGKFHLDPGEWSDDTSMALCLAESLLESGGFDARDQMERYSEWAFTGKFSSRPQAFGFGQTFLRALMRYKKTGDSFPGLHNPKRPGNGCIMRLAPLPIFYFPDRQQVLHFAGMSSQVTHGMPESVFATRLFSQILMSALAGASKEEILFGQVVESEAPEEIQAIAQGVYREKEEQQIESTFFAGRCLEAALWCFLYTDSYREAVLKAVNLGGDADSTGAVCGQLAGAYYGHSQIPSEWLATLAKGDLVLEMADRLYERVGEREAI